MAGIAGCLGDDEGEYPNREITAMVPFGTGGGYDWYVRNTAPYVEEHLPGDATVVVDNVEGGGGLSATNQLWGSEPDGYTYLMRHGLSSVWHQIAIPDEVEYEVTEFTDLGIIADTMYGWVQGSHIDPIESFDDLIAAIEDGARVGTGGVGDAQHLFPIVFGQITDAWGIDDPEFVHFDGVGEYSAAMDREEVELGTPTSASALPYFDDGIMEPILAFNDEIYPGWEDGATVHDWDLPNADEVAESLRAPRIWSAPPGMEEDRRDVLADALYAAAEDDDFLAEAEENERPVGVQDAATAEETTEALYNTWQGQEELLSETIGG